MAEALWQTMNEGRLFSDLRAHILKFNGGLFESTKACHSPVINLAFSLRPPIAMARCRAGHLWHFA